MASFHSPPFHRSLETDKKVLCFLTDVLTEVINHGSFPFIADLSERCSISKIVSLVLIFSNLVLHICQQFLKCVFACVGDPVLLSQEPRMFFAFD